jgi:hypothetical protein
MAFNIEQNKNPDLFKNAGYVCNKDGVTTSNTEAPKTAVKVAPVKVNSEPYSEYGRKKINTNKPALRTEY